MPRETPQPEEISKPKVVVVEGKDEVNLFQALLDHLDISDVDLKDLGRYKLRSNLDALAKTASFRGVQSVGLLFDAEGRFDSEGSAIATESMIRTALAHASLPVPSVGSRSADGPPRVTFMILTPNRERGAVENILVDSVKDTDTFSCVESYLACLKAQGLVYSTVAREAKATVHAFLVTRVKDPDIRVGEAAKAGLWPWNNPAFDELQVFFRRL